MPPFGGPSSAQVLKSRRVPNAGMSYPLLPATSCSTESFSHRRSSKLFPADLFGEKFQHCSATLGASRTATAQAEGGFMIRALWPEISALLLLESSQAKTPSGSSGISFLKYS